jgi:hypothetical protein
VIHSEGGFYTLTAIHQYLSSSSSSPASPRSTPPIPVIVCAESGGASDWLAFAFDQKEKMLAKKRETATENDVLIPKNKKIKKKYS